MLLSIVVSVARPVAFHGLKQRIVQGVSTAIKRLGAFLDVAYGLLAISKVPTRGVIAQRDAGKKPAPIIIEIRPRRDCSCN